jgi:hypothetical protein
MPPNARLVDRQFSGAMTKPYKHVKWGRAYKTGGGQATIQPTWPSLSHSFTHLEHQPKSSVFRSSSRWL